MIHSENTLTCAFFHIQNESYIPQLFTGKVSPSVLMGWWLGIGMASTCEKTTNEIARIETLS